MNTPTQKNSKPVQKKNRNLPKEGFARPAQVAFAFGVSTTTIYNWVRKGIFPAPQKLGERITVWPVDLIRHHLEQFKQSTQTPAA